MKATYYGRPEVVQVLLKQHLSAEEETKTAALMRELRPARARGYLTREELEKVCRWKSARAIHLINRNSVARVRTATRRALTTRSERRRLEALTTLDGVSVAMASAILTLLNPAVTASSIYGFGNCYTLSGRSQKNRAVLGSTLTIGTNS